MLNFQYRNTNHCNYFQTILDKTELIYFCVLALTHSNAFSTFILTYRNLMLDTKFYFKLVL